MSIKLIMPMAGDGNRFKEKGYDIQWSIGYNLQKYCTNINFFVEFSTTHTKPIIHCDV